MAQAATLKVWQTELLDYREYYPDAAPKDYKLKGGYATWKILGLIIAMIEPA